MRKFPYQIRTSLTIGGNQTIPRYRWKSLTKDGSPLLYEEIHYYLNTIHLLYEEIHYYRRKCLTIGGNQEIPRYRRESIAIEGNPLLGTKPLSLEGIPYYIRKSLAI